MKTVFVDTLYWVARAKTNDPWADSAKKAEQNLGNALYVTTDEVLTEFLTLLSKGGKKLRKKATLMVHAILNNPNVRVVPQSRNSFLKGLEFYEERNDKEYSLTDCVSMNVMKAENLKDVLSNDHHFEQEGFSILIKQKS
ncbi:MAG: type II toxin-antitoxin system VapC family toxin [Nitrospinales bacterium]